MEFLDELLDDAADDLRGAKDIVAIDERIDYAKTNPEDAQFNKDLVESSSLRVERLIAVRAFLERFMPEEGIIVDEVAGIRLPPRKES